MTDADQTPYWQSGPCPPWCVALHRVQDHPDDRSCWSGWAAHLMLSMYPVHEVRHEGCPEPLRHEPEVAVFLRRRYRESEPRVIVEPEVIRPDLPPLQLTVAEAQQLGAALIEAATVATGQHIPAPQRPVVLAGGAR
ncbi:hypothetical protein ABZ863_01800 [Saccharomonospora sp. NPDC046836]|uniref:DUF6907 domain-containing protein n=1 Tax=Saccharomonospora sp. NPDC046836 TaxID=3156921 RepID=UPI0033C43720